MSSLSYKWLVIIPPDEPLTNIWVQYVDEICLHQVRKTTWADNSCRVMFVDWKIAALMKFECKQRGLLEYIGLRIERSFVEEKRCETWWMLGVNCINVPEKFAIINLLPYVCTFKRWRRSCCWRWRRWWRRWNKIYFTSATENVVGYMNKCSSFSLRSHLPYLHHTWFTFECRLGFDHLLDRQPEELMPTLQACRAL